EQTYLEGKADGKAEAKAENQAELILRVLQKRGIPLTPDDRARITTCTDLDTLTRWFDRSLTAASAADLFADAED
ncbi:hypothetical protein ACH4C6_15545, partial [Streptomyces sp. NPDC017943]